jgi:uncharacterized membrane protein
MGECRAMSSDGPGPKGDGIDVGDILDQLEELEDSITTSEGQEELRHTKRMLKHLPGTERISKYTSRDLGEAFVGSIIFGLPLLVEDGVFVIAQYLLDSLVLGVPVFLIANAVFVVTLTTGLLYAVDFREIQITNPIFGLVPRRLVGVLTISYLTAAGLMVMWGRMFIGEPTSVEMVARITVIWTAASIGASLGDILPGESKGTDLTLGNIDELVG